MKKFIVLVVGQFVSSIGSGLTDFGLAIYVLNLTHSVSATAAVSICAFFPSILLTPLGGVLADRYDRRLMMMIGELLSGLGLIICLMSVMSSSPSMVVICVGIGVSSIFTALMEPAFKATITDMISKEDFAKAGGLVQISGNAKLLISPMLAGFLLTFTTVSTLMIIDIFTFLTTAITIALIRNSMQDREHAQNHNTEAIGLCKELETGLDALKNTQGARTLVLIMTLAVFCLGFVQILSKPMVLAYATESELGTLTTVVAIGMLVGSVLISCMKHIKSYQRLLAVGLMGCGLFMTLMGMRESIILTACFGFLMFVCMPFIQISAEVMIRRNLRNEVQGRAFGVIGFVSQMGYIVAYLCSGILSDYVFEPFMCSDLPTAALLGSVIGVGKGRGIGLLVVLVGLLLVLVGLMTFHSDTIKTLGTVEA